MYYLLDKSYDETLTINFIGSEQFTYSGNTLILVTPCISGVTDITSYSDTISGETSNVYLEKYFRYKNCINQVWSDVMPMSAITSLEFCSDKPLLLELRYYRVDNTGINSGVTITLSNVSISGTYDLTMSDSEIILVTGDPAQILEVGDILKIFSITDFTVISTDPTNESFTIKYRYSQNDKLTWTEWEPLTKPNITTVRWDKLRFVDLQYLFILNPGYTTPVKIYEVLLYGDFQNVTLNSTKLNMFGLKENCINIAFPPANITDITSGINENETLSAKTPDSNTLSLITESSEYQLRMNFLTQGLNCYSDPEGISQIDLLKAENESNKANFWNPYDFNKIIDFHNMLSTQISEMLGMVVDYHLADVDGNGIDKILNEIQLFNIVAYKTIKVVVPENQFPDNQIVINQFNLDLFDTFKVHIVKEDFKKAFGINKRPGQEDILYFCQTNRMYIVKHAQIHKDVMNAGVYYNVILEKYEQRSNVLNRIEESRNKIEELTRNTTIDELFGIEQEDDFKQIANKEQMKPHSFDFNRLIINSNTVIIKEAVYNGDIKIIESVYDLANVPGTTKAIEYTKLDNVLLESDNRSFIVWFNIPSNFDENNAITKRVIANYDIDDSKYYFINNRTEDGLGYDIWYQQDKIWLMINDTIHSMNADVMKDVWFAVLINIDQRQRTVEMSLLRRNSTVYVTLFHPTTYEKMVLDLETDISDIEYEMEVNGFRAVHNEEIVSTQSNPSFKEMNTYFASGTTPLTFEHNMNLSVNGSKMYLTNIRILNDLVRSDIKQVVLNELIIKNAQHLILADNAIKKLQTTNYPNKQWR